MSESNGTMNTTVTTAENKKYILRLFVAGDESNSKKAEENLIQLCETYIQGQYEVEIVDVLEDFQVALDNNVMLTPALIVVVPKPIMILGNLSDKEKVLGALGLSGDKS